MEEQGDEASAGSPEALHPGGGDTSMPAPQDPASVEQPPGLEEQLQQKEAEVQKLTRQLQHYRSWVASVHARVLHMNPKAVQNAKRLYVGNLPADATEEELCAFLNKLMKQTGAQVGPDPAVLQCHITQERNFAFAEFQSVEEASNAMGLDGVIFRDCSLKIRRPSNYDLVTSLMLGPITPDPTMDTSCLNVSKPVPEESPNKLFVGGLPCEWPESAVRMILEPWGAIKAFNLVMDKATGNSKGYAFCEFEDPSVTDKAILGLNGQRAGTKTLTVKRAAEGARQTSSSAAGAALAGGSAAGMGGGADDPTRMGTFARNSKAGGPSSTTTTTYIMAAPTPVGMVLGPAAGIAGPPRPHSAQPYLASGRGMTSESPLMHMAPQVVYPGQPHAMRFTAAPPMGGIIMAPPPGGVMVPASAYPGPGPAGGASVPTEHGGGRPGSRPHHGATPSRQGAGSMGMGGWGGGAGSTGQGSNTKPGSGTNA